MLTGNAELIFSDNVTCFGKNQSCSNRSHSFQFVFQLVFPTYILQLPSISALPTAFKKFWSNKHSLSLEQVGISPTYQVTYLLARHMKVDNSQDVNKANGMLTSKAKRIFSNNVTWIGVICQTASSKLSASWLHGISVSIQKIQRLYCKAIFATPPIVLAVTIHTLPRVETCPLSF